MATTPTRAEHLAWCKERALQYANAGDVAGAIASMGQDLETAESVHVVYELMAPLAAIGNFDTPGELRKFIEGFR